MSMPTMISGNGAAERAWARSRPPSPQGQRGRPITFFYKSLLVLLFLESDRLTMRSLKNDLCQLHSSASNHSEAQKRADEP